MAERFRLSVCASKDVSRLPPHGIRRTGADTTFVVACQTPDEMKSAQQHQQQPASFIRLLIRRCARPLASNDKRPPADHNGLAKKLDIMAELKNCVRRRNGRRDKKKRKKCTSEQHQY